MSRNTIQFKNSRRPGTIDLDGKLYFSGSANPTISGSTNVGFRGVSSVTRTATGSYTVTFDRTYLDLVSWSYGELGTDNTGSYWKVSAEETNLKASGSLTLKAFSRLTNAAHDPAEGQGVSIRFTMKSSTRG